MSKFVRKIGGRGEPGEAVTRPPPVGVTGTTTIKTVAEANRYATELANYKTYLAGLESSAAAQRAALEASAAKAKSDMENIIEAEKGSIGTVVRTTEGGPGVYLYKTGKGSYTPESFRLAQQSTNEYLEAVEAGGAELDEYTQRLVESRNVVDKGIREVTDWISSASEPLKTTTTTKSIWKVTTTDPRTGKETIDTFATRADVDRHLERQSQKGMKAPVVSSVPVSTVRYTQAQIEAMSQSEQIQAGRDSIRRRMGDKVKELPAALVEFLGGGGAGARKRKTTMTEKEREKLDYFEEGKPLIGIIKDSELGESIMQLIQDTKIAYQSSNPTKLNYVEEGKKLISINRHSDLGKVISDIQEDRRENYGGTLPRSDYVEEGKKLISVVPTMDIIQTLRNYQRDRVKEARKDPSWSRKEPSYEELEHELRLITDINPKADVLKAVLDFQAQRRAAPSPVKKKNYVEEGKALLQISKPGDVVDELQGLLEYIQTNLGSDPKGLKETFIEEGKKLTEIRNGKDIIEALTEHLDMIKKTRGKLDYYEEGKELIDVGETTNFAEVLSDHLKTLKTTKGAETYFEEGKDLLTTRDTDNVIKVLGDYIDGISHQGRTFGTIDYEDEEGKPLIRIKGGTFREDMVKYLMSLQAVADEFYKKGNYATKEEFNKWLDTAEAHEVFGKEFGKPKNLTEFMNRLAYLGTEMTIGGMSEMIFPVVYGKVSVSREGDRWARFLGALITPSPVDYALGFALVSGGSRARKFVSEGIENLRLGKKLSTDQIKALYKAYDVYADTGLIKPALDDLLSSFKNAPLAKKKALMESLNRLIAGASTPGASGMSMGWDPINEVDLYIDAVGEILDEAALVNKFFGLPSTYPLDPAAVLALIGQMGTDIPADATLDEWYATIKENLQNSSSERLTEIQESIEPGEYIFDDLLDIQTEQVVEEEVVTEGKEIEELVPVISLDISPIDITVPDVIQEIVVKELPDLVTIEQVDTEQVVDVDETIVEEELLADPILRQVQLLRARMLREGRSGVARATEQLRIKLTKEKKKQEEARRIPPSKKPETFYVYYQYSTGASEREIVKAKAWRQALITANGKRKIRLVPLETTIERRG